MPQSEQYSTVYELCNNSVANYKGNPSWFEAESRPCYSNWTSYVHWNMNLQWKIILIIKVLGSAMDSYNYSSALDSYNYSHLLFLVTFKSYSLWICHCNYKNTLQGFLPFIFFYKCTQHTGSVWVLTSWGCILVHSRCNNMWGGTVAAVGLGMSFQNLSTWHCISKHMAMQKSWPADFCGVTFNLNSKSFKYLKMQSQSISSRTPTERGQDIWKCHHTYMNNGRDSGSPA